MVYPIKPRNDPEEVTVPSLARLIREFREASGKSRNEIANASGMDTSYLTRIEHGERASVGRHILVRLGMTFGLDNINLSKLLVAGGFAPVVTMHLPTWDETLQEVADVLVCRAITNEELRRFKARIHNLTQQYMTKSGIGGRAWYYDESGAVSEVAQVPVTRRRASRDSSRPVSRGDAETRPKAL